MGRTKVTVDEAELRQVVNELEEKNSYANRSYLFKAIAETEWAKNGKYTVSVISNRITEFKIEVKTEKGRVGGGVKNPGGTRKTRVVPAKNLRALAQIVPERFKGALKKLEKGSLTAAIRLKCLDCTDYQRAEIVACPIISCALHHVRPYKGSPESSMTEGLPEA